MLDVRGISTFCDYFVIASGTSLRQINALAGIIETDLNKDGISSLSRISPNDESGWVVLDYSGVVMHLFYKPVREYYCLERLWADAKKIRIPAK